ncbi:MAG TPA: hypothetical protein VKC66_11625 [Xanthobacteraceae bacterium]|nr:hypothetical protein [Xanthobacteraceae bacterium]
MRREWWIYLLILVFSSVSDAVRTQGEVVNMVPLQKSLRIVPGASGRLFALMHLKNVADFTVYVLKTPPSIFIDSEGEEINEIGRSEKRRPYTIKDYTALPPDGQVDFRVDLTDLYAWKPGRHPYEASITGNYADPVDGRQWNGPRIIAKFDWR